MRLAILLAGAVIAHVLNKGMTLPHNDGFALAAILFFAMDIYELFIKKNK